MQSFLDTVKNNSYIAKAHRESSAKNKKVEAMTEAKKYTRAISMDDLAPNWANKPKRPISTSSKETFQNEKQIQWQELSDTVGSNNNSLSDKSTNKKTGQNQPTNIVENSHLAYSSSGENQNTSKYSVRSSESEHSFQSKNTALDSPKNSRYSSQSQQSINNGVKSNVKYEDASNTVSPTTSTKSFSRTRDPTTDSLSFVKFTPAVVKFEDLKSEAMNSWVEGVDIQLESKGKQKKKSEWLSQSDFFSDDIDPLNRQQDTENHRSLDFQSNSTCDVTKIEAHPPKKQTYAEVVDKKTPAWAIDDHIPVNHTIHHPVPLQYQDSTHKPVNMNGWPRPPIIAPSAQMQPIVMMASTYIPMTSPQVANLAKDNQLLIYLYSVVSKPDTRSVIKDFQKKLDSIIGQNLVDISQRTFGLLIEALVVLLETEMNQSEERTARKIQKNWQPFQFCIKRYIQSYAYLPNDLKSLLKFVFFMSRFTSNIKNDIPIQDISEIFDNIKPFVSIDINNEITKLLKILLPENNSADAWELEDSTLPDVPTPKSIVSEIIYSTNALKDYESKNECSISNMVQEPWPDMNLSHYLLVHFMLLRDELVSSAQRVIKELFKGNGCYNIRIPGSFIYENSMPRTTTFMVSSSEPAIVFKLGEPHPNEQLLNNLKEGALAIILPEVGTSVTNKSQAKKKVSDLAIMGHLVRPFSFYPNKGELVRLVSIHINKSELSKINWDGHYTIVVTNINAPSIMSVLNWLHDQYTKSDSKQFSSVLTPRILATSNTLSNLQLNSLPEMFYDHNSSLNESIIPSYLQGAEIDINCIMTKPGNYHAKPSEGGWPSLAPKLEQLSHSIRPSLYCLSPSQLDAVKYALTHRVAVISGASGTGKTYLANKLAQLLSQALHIGQFHQPVLILTKSQHTLDEILSNVVENIPDVIRFGGDPSIPSLISKQATKLAVPTFTDSNFRQFQILERQLLKNQSKLSALFKARFQATHHDPAVLSSAIAPVYLEALIQGYRKDPNLGIKESNPSTALIWEIWTKDDEMTRNYRKSYEQYDAENNVLWQMESHYLKKNGFGIMPIMESEAIKNRFSWVGKNPSYIASIADASKWPFDTSSGSGTELRLALLNAWKHIPTENLWYLSKSEKTALIQQQVKTLVSFIDNEIEDLLQAQLKTSQAVDEILLAKLSYRCRFNRVIGMTADFAAAHHDWVSTLWPRTIIVDEASEIFESVLASSILCARTEHIVLLGTSDNTNKPYVLNEALIGNNRNLDVSLFERWKVTTNEFALLEEQWHMHSDVATIVDQFSSVKQEESSLLITAPLASCSENRVDKRDPELEVLYGITQRAFYIDYQAVPRTPNKEVHYSKQLKVQVTPAEVDEARFVAFFALYISQQKGYSNTTISILTLTLLQKYLIQSIFREEVPRRTCFVKNAKKIHIGLVDSVTGRHDTFVIISTATPGSSISNYDNVSRALTRARYGLFVIGKPEKDQVHPKWREFAYYMQERGLRGNAVKLICHAHGDMNFAGRWEDFNQMKNGGCQRVCDTLMGDGHVCKEDCHSMGHEEVVCEEPCNRLRPSNCQHECRRKCFECEKAGFCPPCMVESSVTLSCGHSYTDVCHKLLHLDSIECDKLMTVTLPCGHKTSVKCHERKDTKKILCRETVKVALSCGHSVIQDCGMATICTELCSKNLDCGHKCMEICGIDHTHERSRCKSTCPKQLICGHQCAKGCANPDEHTERCLQKCNYKCSHEYTCSRECWRDCIRCVSECPYKCDHFKCTKKCYEICNRPPCNAPCRKRLPCSHVCSGLCGEKCPPCKTCYPNLQCSISLRILSEFDEDEKVYMLPECGCIYSVELLDMYFQNQAKNGEHTAIRLWDCPKCKKPIYTALRYNGYIKTEISLVNEIKLKLEQERQILTSHEKYQIIKAMDHETQNHATHNIVGGRWFVCPNQHPYYVGDCGGATEVTKCPECHALIGGTGHKVVETNRFYGEFDGSKKPAWPGQPGV